MFVSQGGYWGLPREGHDEIFRSNKNIFYIFMKVGVMHVYDLSKLKKWYIWVLCTLRSLFQKRNSTYWTLASYIQANHLGVKYMDVYNLFWNASKKKIKKHDKNITILMIAESVWLVCKCSLYKSFKFSVCLNFFHIHLNPF